MKKYTTPFLVLTIGATIVVLYILFFEEAGLHTMMAIYGIPFIVIPLVTDFILKLFFKNFKKLVVIELSIIMVVVLSGYIWLHIN